MTGRGQLDRRPPGALDRLEPRVQPSGWVAVVDGTGRCVAGLWPRQARELARALEAAAASADELDPEGPRTGR